MIREQQNWRKMIYGDLYKDHEPDGRGKRPKFTEALLDNQMKTWARSLTFNKDPKGSRRQNAHSARVCRSEKKSAVTPTEAILGNDRFNQYRVNENLGNKM